MINLQIESSWDKILTDEFSQPYFSKLQNFLIKENKQFTIYPENCNIFYAFRQTPFEHVKVVILGQDPYHGANQAHGLAFSVNHGITIPPSLQNIYKELYDDLQCPIANHGNLTKWAQEGVLLLNSVLTVRANEANSHKKIGWERFTDTIIQQLSQKKEHLVFILWGAPAAKKEFLIDATKHLILKAPHPSPLSSYRGFFGSKPFSKTNDYLQSHLIEPIHWRLE